MNDRPVFKRLNELLVETDAQIDGILGGQDNPQEAAALAKEIKEKGSEFFVGCCRRYYKLLREVPGNI